MSGPSKQQQLQSQIPQQQQHLPQLSAMQPQQQQQQPRHSNSSSMQQLLQPQQQHQQRESMSMDHVSCIFLILIV
jgi:hypothetical protein